MSVEYLLHDGRTMTPEEMCEEIQRLSRDTAIVWVALWDSEGVTEAQVYTTEDGARRDFPGERVIRSTVQP